MQNILFFLAALSAPSCASLQRVQMGSLCNTEGAYQDGYNTALQGEKMDSSFAEACSPVDQTKVRKSYREGFQLGLQQRASEPKPVEVRVVHEDASPGPGWGCKESFGKKRCGYDCKEAYGAIQCARYRGGNCVSSFGKIKCGMSCREEFGKALCDREDQP